MAILQMQPQSSRGKNLEDLQLAIRAELEIRITGFQTPSSKTWLSPAMHAQAQTTQVD